jgi:PhnB protein
MVKNPPEGTLRITPYLLYNDVSAALDWLGRAFGLKERMRIAGKDGKVTHAEMTLAEGVVMMGCPGPEYKNPKTLGSVTQMLYIYVEDVDKHFQIARKAGAKIIAEPEDQFYGDRRYGAEDPEGHQWYFGQHIKDVSPEEMKKHG